MIIGTLGQICCFFKIKSDVEQIMEDSIGQYTREDKINILMAGNEKLNIHLGNPFAYVSLFVAIFGLIACLCLVFGARKSSEKLLLPSLVFFPINCLKYTVFSILFAISLGFSNPINIIFIVLNVINAITHGPAWITIYSLRQELLENAGGTNYELAQQRADIVGEKA